VLATPPRNALGPLALVAANALVFCLVRPDVPDLWAARARAAAAADGVGVTYWFSWFGGSTPGGYSVISPFLSAVAGPEVVAAMSAVAVAALAAPLLHDTLRPTAAAWVAAMAVVTNLWCGRVPFLLGSAFAVGSLLLVRRRRPAPAAVLAAVAVLASPVAGAFLVLVLAGALVTPTLRGHRAGALMTGGAGLATLALLAALFGHPGPEPFPPYLLAETLVSIALLMVLAPGPPLRATLAVSTVAALVVFVVPNALGANFVRLALFCLPAAAVALTRRRRGVVAALVAPVVALGGLTSVSAAQSALRPGSHASFYAALAAELDRRPALDAHRLELVSTGWAAYAVLTGHALLARGWETQSSHALDAALTSRSLDAPTYRAWLDDNAVGYVAVNTRGARTPEARLIGSGPPRFLRLVWSHAPWRLYQVRRPTPIVRGPATLAGWSQAALHVRMPRAGHTLVRTRWTPFLTASPGHPTLAPGPAGWTVLTTDRPGTYELTGLW
jgi:hypothetical protein